MDSRPCASAWVRASPWSSSDSEGGARTCEASALAITVGYVGGGAKAAFSRRSVCVVHTRAWDSGHVARQRSPGNDAGLRGRRDARLQRRKNAGAHVPRHPATLREPILDGEK